MHVELNSSSCTNDDQEARAATAFGDAQPADSRTDVQLMARIAAGDGDAFQELVKLHGPQLATFIGRLTAWHADRDDLLQETLLAVWDNARGYDERGSLKQWLFQIAVNRVKNYFRATQRLKRRLEKFAALRPSGSNFIQANKTQRELSSSALSRALGELSFADRLLAMCNRTKVQQPLASSRPQLPPPHTGKTC